MISYMRVQKTLIITSFVYEKQPAKNSMTLIWPFIVIQG